MVPSLVTCPTMKIVMLFSFARRSNVWVDSRTCPTLPGALPASSRYMVWMESITTASGFSRTMTSEIKSKLVSHRKNRSPENSPSRSALSLIWLKDSSPEI